MKEADLSSKIIKELRKKGAWAQKIHGSAFQTKGLPDIIGCYYGCFFGFEVKLPGRESTLTPLQAATLEAINKAGGYAEMITTVLQATTALDQLYDNLEDE